MTLKSPGLIQIGMHGNSSAGGVDRYFWGLNEALQLEMTEWSVRTFAFGPCGGNREFSETHQDLGNPNLPLVKRMRSVRQSVKMVPGFPGKRCVLASHFSLYAFPLLPELTRVRHVVHFHGPWSQESDEEAQGRFKVLVKKRVERLVFRSAFRFITLSNAFRDLLISTYGVAPSRVHVIPGGVDPARFRPGKRSAARDVLGWPKDGRILLCVRRLTPRMGLSNLVAAFSMIAARYSDVRLFLAGKGPLQDALQSQILALGLQKRVHLLGFVEDASLPLAYQAADFSVVPSKRLEGFGLTTLESLACGTPVLVTPVGGLPEVMEPLSPSCILDGAGREQIAAGLDYALGGNLALPSPEACVNYVQKRFLWSRIARQVLGVYEEAIGGMG